MTGTVDGVTETGPADRTLVAPEDPSHAGRTDLEPRLSVDGFDGPLDGLLEMARAHKIDLASLSIAALVEAFAAALEAALTNRAGARLEHWAAWTVTAAALTELWSRLMLPPETSEARAVAAEAEALREQFAGRARMQVTADWLDQRVRLGQDVFRRGRPEATLSVRGGDLTELLRACLVVLRVPEDQAVALRPRPPPLWTASDAIRQILRLLPGLSELGPLAAFLPKIDSGGPKRMLRCRVAVASTLFAGLELARNGALVLEQDADWMPIRVSRGETGDPATSDSAPPA